MPLSPSIAQDISNIKMEILFNREAAAFYMPFSSLPITESEDCPTLRTDGRQIQIGAEFFNRQEQAKKKGLYFHEIVHNALCHTSFEHEVQYPKLLKYAEEIAVNNIVLTCGFELPEGEDAGIVDRNYIGWSTLAIYNDLAKNPPPEEDLPQCGCAQKGIKSDIPEEKLQPVLTPSSARQKINEVEQNLKAIGADSSILEPISELVRQLANPKLDWTEELRDSFIKSFDGETLDMANPIKQLMHFGVYQPKYKDENIDNLFLALDLSSSVTDYELGKAQDIIDDIRQLYDIEQTTIITYNHNVIDRFDYGAHEDIDLMGLDSGGGTCTDSVFEYIEDHGDSPFTLLVISDMEDHIETEYVNYPVIWLNTSDYEPFTYGGKPNFGKFINVNELV
jgi:predicted metal-dependent peptidase